MRRHDMVFLDHHGARKFGHLRAVKQVTKLSLARDSQHDLSATISDICFGIFWRGCEEGIEKCMASLGGCFAGCHFEVLSDNRVSNWLGLSVNLTHVRLLERDVVRCGENSDNFHSVKPS